MKGAARPSAAAIAELLGLPACRQDGDPQCPLCRLFGAAGIAGAVRWSAATLAPGDQTVARRDVLAVRRQPVDRALGVSRDTPLPTHVALPAGLRFHASLHGWLAGDGRWDAALLSATLLRLPNLAGSYATGFGRVSISIDAVRLAGEPQDVGALLDALLAQEVV